MTQAILLPKSISQISIFVVYGGLFFENNIEIPISHDFDTFPEALKYYSKLKTIFPDNCDIDIQEQIIKKIHLIDKNNIGLPEKEKPLPTINYKHIESGKFWDGVISKDSINGFYNGILFLTVEERIFFVTSLLNDELHYEDVTDKFEKVSV